MKTNITTELSPQWLEEKVQQMKIAREEQELTLNFDPIDGICTVYTSIPSLIKKYLNNPIVQKGNLKVLTAYKGKPTSIEIKVEKNLFDSNFFKKKRVISDAHKKALLNGRRRIQTLKTDHKNRDY